MLPIRCRILRERNSLPPMPESPMRSRAHSAKQMKRAAWERALPRVSHIISLMMSLPKDQRRGHEPDFRGRVSVADAVVLEHHLGRIAAARVTEMMNPWQLPGENTRASLAIEVCIRNAASKVAEASKHFSRFAEESITVHLLSPLLANKWDMPPFVPKPRSTSTIPLAPSNPKSLKHQHSVEIAPAAPPGFFHLSHLSLLNSIQFTL